jgi:transposase
MRKHPVGESSRILEGFAFNGSLKVMASEQPLTENAGALVLREALERLGTVKALTTVIRDPRRPENITHPLGELLTQRILLLAQGFAHQDDADRLRDDPALRLAASERRGVAALEPWPAPQPAPTKNPPAPQGLGSQPTHSRLMRLLSDARHRTALRDELFRVASVRLRAQNGGHRRRYVTLDVDSFPVEVSGEQEGAEYNGHYQAVIFHPLVASLGEPGDYLDVVLRPGNVATADGVTEFVLPLLDRMEREICQVAALRIDAGMPSEKLLGPLDDRGTPYLARLKTNAVLDRLAQPWLTRPPGPRPKTPRSWLHELRYAAKSWSRERRVVLVVQEKEGKEELHAFWLLTNWAPEQVPADELLEHYRQRGTGEGHHGELMSTLRPALSSSARPKTHYRGRSPARRYPPGDSFAINEATLLLNVLAYNVMHVARTQHTTARGEGVHLKTLRAQALRAAARLKNHAGQVIVLLAAGAFSWWEGLLPHLQALG